MQEQPVFERYFTRAEERQILQAARRQAGDVVARRDYWLMVAMRHSGGRVSSMVGLTVEDAQHAIADKILTFRKVKGGRVYKIPANRVLRVAMRELLKVRAAMGFKNHDPAALLLTSRQGAWITVRTVQLRVKHWREVAGLPDGTPHFFRHTLGRRLVEDSTSPAPQRIAQRILGHTNPSSTAIYISPGREDLRQAMEGQA